MQKLKKILFFSLTLSLVFFFGSTLLFKKTVFADGLVGTHLGEGDLQAQIDIINNVLVRENLGKGSPVTAMVDVNLFDGDLNLFHALSKAIKDAGYFPMIRVNGVCNTTVNPVSVVDTINKEFGGQVYISWGNEIGHWSNECNDGNGHNGWGNYVTGFNQIKDMKNVSPSTLDYYGADAITALMAFPGMSDIFNTDRTRAAVAYGCVYDIEPNCNPSTTRTQEDDYTPILGSFYLTEFSLGPNNNPAPDTNLDKVIKFIKTRSQETNALKITPLIKNVCNNEGHWLLYINGRVFTKFGTEVTNSCKGNQTSSYDLDNYPSYETNDNEFYLTSIAQVSYPADGNKLGALVKELTYTGYEAYCIAEDVNIEPSFNTDGIIKKFLEQYPGGIANLEATSYEELNSENAKYPNWRDVSGKKFLFTSLEEYLGFKDVYETDASKSELNSAAANSLMSDKQICTQGWKDLDAQLNMCYRLENPEGCALFPRPVPGTGFTIKTLLEERRKFEEFIAYSVNNENIKANCDTLLSEKYPQWNELTKGIMNTPIDFDRAYRIGFIVASIRTTKIIPDIPLTMFNFFTQEGKYANGEMPTDEVLVIAFKLPDVGTSKGNIPQTGLTGHELEEGGDDPNNLFNPVPVGGHEHISISEFWRDPLDLTRRVLSSTVQETKYQYNRELVRRRTRSKSINAGDQTENSDIYCYKGNWPPDDTTYATDTCKNELPRALVNIINGTAKIDILTQKPKKCGGDSEIVSTIEDLANLGEPSDSRRFFKEGGPDTTSGGHVLLNMFASVIGGYGVENYNDPDGDGITDPRVASNNFPSHLFKSNFNFNEKEYPPKTVDHTTASYYLVYPVGFDLSQVENTLKGAFFSSTQIKDMEDQSKATKFDMNDTVQALHGGGVSHTFVDNQDTEDEKCGVDINGDPIDCHSTFSVNIIGGSGGMNVLGAEFGWWLRKIQASLNSSATSAHSYLQSCETTEEFLLGKCGQ